MVLILAFASIASMFAQTPFGTEIKNIAHMRYSDPGGFEYNVESQEIVTVVAPAYLLNITKSVESPVYLPTDTVKYLIEVSNNGNFIASSFMVSDTLAGDLVFLSTQPAAHVEDNVLTWENLSLEPGASMQFNINCLVPPGFSTDEEIENIAHLKTLELVEESSESASIVIGNKASLNISKNVSRQSAKPGESLNYNIHITNLGNAPAYNVLLFDDLPQELVFVSASDDKQEQSGIVSWSIGDIYPGDIIERNVTVVIRDGVLAGTDITNFATVSSGGENKHATAVVRVAEPLGEPELRMQRSMPSFASPLDTVSYYIFFENQGEAAATALELKEKMNEHFEYISSSKNAQYDYFSNELTWFPNSLSVGDKDSVKVTVLVTKSVPDGTFLRSEASLICYEGKSVSAFSDILVESPLFLLNKSAAHSTVQAGEELNYVIDYINNGHGLAKNVVINDTLSADVDFVSASGTYHYFVNDRVVQWLLSDVEALMSSAKQLSLTVQVHQPMINGSVISNNASLETKCGFYADDTSRVIVESAPGLSLVKSSQSTAFVGDTIRYIFNYFNNGNAIAEFPMILDTLSDHLEFLSATGAYNYNPEYHLVSWNMANLGLGAEASVELNVRIKEDHFALTEISNTASIYSLGLKSVSNTCITKVNPFNLSITADPDSIIGNGEDITKLTASVFDKSGRPVEDGTEVRFFSDQGTLLSSTTTALTLNGYANMDLRSSVVDEDYLPLTVSAEINAADGMKLTDSADVVFCAKRIEGIVIDNSGIPVPGAIVLLIQDGIVMGTTISGDDGCYSIAIYNSGDYTVRVQFDDKNGESRTIDQFIKASDDGSGQVDDITYTAAVSGRIVDHMSGEAIHMAGVDIFLSHLQNLSLNKYNDTPDYIDSTQTDTSGFFYFNELDLGDYRIDAIFGKGEYFYAGVCEVSLNEAGIQVINADIFNEPILFSTYKTVDKEVVVKGDSLRYTIHFQTLNNVISDTIHLVDQLPEEVEFISSSFINGLGMRFEAYNTISNELSFLRYGMHAQQQDSITFLVEVKENVEKDITNTAFIYTENDTAFTANDIRTRATSSIIAPFLVVKKTVNTQVAEMGDILTYTVEISNQSDDRSISNFLLSDKLPSGFRYKEGRTIMGSSIIADPEMLMHDGRETLVWHIDEEIPSGQSVKIKYRTVVGMNCNFGENENMASARGYFQSGDQVLSNTSTAKVVIKPSMMQGYGFIFGKVFFDRNGNNMHDNDEETFKNVEIVTEDGIRVTTDEYGKYSIPSIRTGAHVLKINPVSLPKKTHIVMSSSDFLGDASSRLVKLSPTGIAKANFVLAGEDFVPERKVTTKSVSKPDKKKGHDKATLYIAQETLTRSLRMTDYDPWDMKLALNYNVYTNKFEIDDHKALQDIKNYLLWRKDVTVLVQEIFRTKGPELNTMREAIDADRCPVDVLCSELQSLGIEKRRLKCRYLKDKSVVEKNTDRIVKLTFFPARVAPNGEQRIDMQLDLDYAGPIVLNKVKFYTYFPKGFILDENSTTLDFATVTPHKLSSTSVVWDLGELYASKEHELSFKLRPNVTEQIGTHSSIVSMLEYTIEGGKLHQTPLMMNTIETEVNRILFNEVLGDEHFDFHLPDLKSEHDPAIAKVAEFLRWQPWATLSIEGYSDNVGSWKVGKVLSERRAQSVRDVLISKYHIMPDRIQVKGYGPAYPIADNTTVEGRAANRRVEIRAISRHKQIQNKGDILFDDSIEITIEK